MIEMNAATLRKLAPLVLLALIRVYADDDDEDYEDICKDKQPTVTIKTASIQNNANYINIAYGENVSVVCSSSSAVNLTIQDDEHCLPTKQLNSTTILSDIETPIIGMYRYSCIDGNGCEFYFSVTVSSQISVSSPDVRYALDARGENVYFIPPGKLYEVTCSGNDVKLLHIQTNTEKQLKADTVNNTTLKYQVKADQLNERYHCIAKDSKFEVITWRKSATVVVDYFPEGKNFQCILYVMRRLQCSWDSSSKRNTFKLFYSRSITDPYKSVYTLFDMNDTPFLCAYSSGGTTGSCTWNNNYRGRRLIELRDTFSLVLQACNDVFCNNQTFSVYSNAIMKLDPVSNLKLLSANSRGANVTWRSSRVGVFMYEYEYKVQFRLLAMEWRHVNTSDLQCSRAACGLQLALPCPDSHYELQVFAKLVEATDSRYWSKPSSMFFFTKPSNPDDVIDPVCNTDIEEPEPLPSADGMLYKTRRLVKVERQQTTALKQKIIILKEKMAKVKELMKLLSKPNTPA